MHEKKFLCVSVSEKLSFFPTTTDLPDPVTNCTAYNATAYTMQFSCIPGNDGGIKQSFFVEVINSGDSETFSNSMACSELLCRCLMDERRFSTCHPTNQHFYFENFQAIRNS